MKQKILFTFGCILMASGVWATDYTLTLYADGCSSPNTFICSSGQQLSVNATPMAHRHFVMWNDGNIDNPRLVTMNQNLTYTATFAPDSFNISVVASPITDGSVSGTGRYEYGEQVTITAIPNYGYHFSHWSDGNTTNPRTILVTADTSYTAYFERNIYTMSASGEHGHVDGTGSYPYESPVTLTAIPDFGYLFHHWSDGSEENPRVDTLLGDSTLMAYFVLQYEGPCGDNLTWKYDTKMLTISGTGDMYDYNNKSMPWILLRDSIENVVIEHGATSIGDYAFYGCQNRAFTKLVMPQSVKKIGNYAFADCNRLTTVVFSSDMEEVGDYAFSGCTRINDMTCYATVTPDAAEHTFDGVNTMAYLYVQAGSARTYKLDPYWGVFDIHEIGADSTVISNNQVQVVPADNEAVFTWPMAENADTYSLSITKDGEVFCTLTFNANGQLIGLAFAPSLDGSANAPAATTSIAGMSFTVTGLDGASKYAYRLAAKDATNEEIVAYSGEFATSGYEGEVIPGGNPENETALDNTSADVKAEKQIINGVLYIIHDGIRYTATGQRAE